ncbi:MAG: hypothetical protein Q7V16_07080 [Hydrogenophaga sp.]|nr:hypothetical protein [Hydrogenophaga sp.]
MIRQFSPAIVCIAVLSGCAYPSPGDKLGEIPPQIVVRNDVRTWDRPGAFGPVPDSLREQAARVCASLDSEKVKHEARGYHPGALNLEGKPFAGGGYYCTPKR